MQFTIEAQTKRSATSHESATFHFGRKTGMVWMLTRNVNGNSCQEHYRHVGQCDANDPKVVHIWSNDYQAKLLAAFLFQKGFKPFGPTFCGDTQLNVYSPQRDGYDFRLTSPETIRAALGKGPKPRRRSLDLGKRGAKAPPLDWRERAAALHAARG